MKFTVVVTTLIFTAAMSVAAIYNYDQYVPIEIDSYVKQIQANSKPVGSFNCEKMYVPMLQDGVFDIRYAFGYFDDTTGSAIHFDGINYGISPSLDGAVFESMRKHLVSRCSYKNMRLCGFTQRGNQNSGLLLFEKEIEIQNRNVLVRITMTQGSVSERLNENTGRYAELQKHFIQQSEINFFGGLREADVVFYNGHSRNGGGPDFNPPVLTKKMKTNYAGYYEVEKPGIKKVLENLNANSNRGFILGLFSCYSRSHFQKALSQQNSELRMILSTDTIDYFDSLKASIGYLEGLLRGQCGSDLAGTARKGSKIRRGYTQYQME